MKTADKKIKTKKHSPNQEKSLIGKMKGKGSIRGDIVKPIKQKWNADF